MVNTNAKIIILYDFLMQVTIFTNTEKWSNVIF
jgi:hypothetical protein